MMEHFELYESTSRLIPMAPGEAEALRRLGRELAGTTNWYGSTSEDPSERSVIACEAAQSGEWRVEVANCVGVIVVGRLHLSVLPKIPLDHFIYILRAADPTFRTVVEDESTVSGSADLWELVAHWYIKALEALLRKGLLSNYSSTVDEVTAVQGRPLPLETANLFYRGVVGAVCEFESFDEDNAWNRTLLAAVREVEASPLLDPSMRQRARRLAARFDRVGPLRASDTRAVLERRERYYRDAFHLARDILGRVGRFLTPGAVRAWSFLIRTPELVESGVRALIGSLLTNHEVSKKGVMLSPTRMTINPDLVFDGGAVVGDVKYKLTHAEWSRSDLYQAVAFATAYRARAALVVGFGVDPLRRLPSVTFGDLPVFHLPWDVSGLVSPPEAAIRLTTEVETILERSAQVPSVGSLSRI